MHLIPKINADSPECCCLDSYASGLLNSMYTCSLNRIQEGGRQHDQGFIQGEGDGGLPPPFKKSPPF